MDLLKSLTQVPACILSYWSSLLRSLLLALNLARSLAFSLSLALFFSLSHVLSSFLSLSLAHSWVLGYFIATASGKDPARDYNARELDGLISPA